MQTIQSVKTFWALLYKEIVVARIFYLDGVINGIIWATGILAPATFFMKSFGVSPDYGTFMVPAILASWGMFDIIGNCTTLMSDINGDRVIEYELTLPIAQWAVFAKIATANAYRSFISAISLLPYVVLFTYYGNGLWFTKMSLIKTVFILTLANFFFGFFGLLVATFMRYVGDVRKVWGRVIFPLWFIGGFNHSWSSIKAQSVLFAKVMLANPIVYVIEGTRAAMLGQEGYLNYWLCIVMLLGFTLVLGYWSIVRLKKRLDCLP